ncbi:MAG: S-layer homology domain-containing protein, partial [Chloroflexia bacterium]
PDAKGAYGTPAQPERHEPRRHGGPDDYGYVFDDEAEPGGPVYLWVTATNRIADAAWERARTVSATTTLDDGVMTTTLPFQFNFYSTEYAQLHISTNGNVHFGAPNDWYPDMSAACLPSTSPYVPRAMVAPLWYDLIVPELGGDGGGVYTTTVGEAPNRVYVVEWRHVSKYNPPFGFATFELLLHETGEMVFQYKDFTNPSIEGIEGVVGIQNAQGTIGLPYSCYQSSVMPNRAIRYKIGPGGTSTPTNTPTITLTPTQTRTPAPCDTAPAWRVVPDANLSGTSILYGVAALSHNDVWAVGYYTATGTGDIYKTLIEHWDGATWSAVPSPNTGAGSNQLSSVAARSPNDVWAVGYYDSLSRGYQSLVEHWDGTAWSIESISGLSERSSALLAVTVVGASDVWAAGDLFNFGVSSTLTIYWDGTTWRIVSSPNPGISGNRLTAITAISANDIWAVGIARNDSNIGSALAIHWDGSVWSPVPTGVEARYLSITGVTAVSADDVWALGSTNSGTASYIAVALHWNGTQWDWTNVPRAGFTNFLYGVSATSADDVWAVGTDAPAVSPPALIVRWNGGKWSTVSNPATGSNYNTLNAVASLSASDIWAVGSMYTTTGTHALLERYTDTFVDVQPSDYFYTAVNYLYCHGVISGYADGTFRPGNYTTRGQLAKIVALAEAWPVYTPPSPTFRDVLPDDPFYQYIETAYHQGVISGYTCGEGCLEYRPGNNTTRGQLCKIVVLAEGWETYTPPTATFRDVLPGDAFYEYIETAYHHGIISGYTCGEGCLEFRTGSNATRGQISKIVYLAVTQP